MGPSLRIKAPLSRWVLGAYGPQPLLSRPLPLVSHGVLWWSMVSLGRCFAALEAALVPLVSHGVLLWSMVSRGRCSAALEAALGAWQAYNVALGRRL
jgi:hypothetical protein